VRRGVASASALAAASAGGVARAAVRTGLAESTLAYATTASAVPVSVAEITQGVFKYMFLRKVKHVMTASAILALLAAGAGAVAQSKINRPKDKTGKPQQVGSSSWTYHILVSRDGEPPRKVAIVELTDDTPIRVDAPGALILIQAKHNGEPDRKTAAIEIGDNTRSENTTRSSAARSTRSKKDQDRGKIVLTSLEATDVNITQRYACQIRGQRHINIRALENGSLTEIKVREGQAVKKGDLMFTIVSASDREKPDDGSTNIIAPFDGILDRLQEQIGSFVKVGDILTTLSDNTVMWAYFNVPENQYLEYTANPSQHEQDKIDLMLANGTIFPYPGTLGGIDSKFNNETGAIAFRADFPNPKGLLRHGQTGTILIHRKVHDAIVIPQRATYETNDKRFVFVVDKDDVAHRREIVPQNETDDFFIIKKGVGAGDRIVLDGIRQLHDGENVKYEFRPFDEAVRKQTKDSQ
jgi:membrane fusion protein (multidrug efflux system)